MHRYVEAMEAMAPGHLRRSVSAPSLDSLADSALSMEATPCSVLDRNPPADDEVLVSLRQTLAETQRELQAAVEAGILELAGGGGNGSGPSGGTHPRPCTSANTSEGEDEPEGSAAANQRRGGGGGGDARQASSSGGASGGGGSAGTGHSLQLELELAGLSAREREAALKRAKNREAARRSRERKVERVASLQADVDRLRSNNFVLLSCVEEVATRALAARAERARLQRTLASLQEQKQGAAGGPGDGAVTPPAAARAAELERQLLQMEAGAPRSPTQLLPLPLWPGHADEALAAALPPSAVRPPPTSAELRRELRDAVVGGGGGSRGSGSSGSAAGHTLTTADHLLQPSPMAARRALRQLQQQAAAPPPRGVVLRLKRGALLRACSAPGELLAGAAADAHAAEGDQPWTQGVAV